MARKRKPKGDEQPNHATEAPTGDDLESVDGEGDESGEPIPQDTLVCALTGKFEPDKPEERVLQSFVEQLHREYRVELVDMERDVRVACQDAAGKKKTVTVGIAVYEHGKPREVDNIIRVVLIAKANAKVSDAAVGQVDLVLSNLSEDRPEVYGAWTNGKDLTFQDRLREIGFYDDLSDAYNAQTIRPRYELRAEESAP